MVPAPLSRQAARQAGVVTRAQCVAAGLSRSALEHLLASDRWQRVRPRVFLTHLGPIPDDARLWAAVLYAGAGAALSHSTAGALHGWPSTSTTISLTVPSARRVVTQPGLTLHRANWHGGDVTTVRGLRCTAPLRTTLDLIATAARGSEAIAAAARAVQRRQVDADSLRSRLTDSRSRWRAAVLPTLEDIAGGSHSALEVAFVQLVRAHGLPVGTKQKAIAGTRADMAWAGVVVELDGRMGHDGAREVWRDMQRDNANALGGRLTLRFGWFDVMESPCQVAAQLGRALQIRPRTCGKSCTLQRA